MQTCAMRLNNPLGNTRCTRGINNIKRIVQIMLNIGNSVRRAFVNNGQIDSVFQPGVLANPRDNICEKFLYWHDPVFKFGRNKCRNSVTILKQAFYLIGGEQAGQWHDASTGANNAKQTFEHFR